MRNRRRVLGVFAAAGRFLCAASARALDKKDADAAIKRFLASKQTGQESADQDSSAIADLNGDGKEEIVLVWRVLGPTYSLDNLTVLSAGPTGYSAAATFPLDGQASLSSVKNGAILVDHLVLGKNDPRCCPTVKKQMKYRWQGTKISEVK